MANYSLSEIDALAKKATRGAGYSWGIAEETGKSVRWLSAYGFLGAEALAKHLSITVGQHQKFVPILESDDSKTIVFNSQDKRSSICALSCCALMNDLGYQIQNDKTLSFKNILFPLLALPAAGRIAEAYNIQVLLKYDETDIICDSNGIRIKDSSVEPVEYTPPLLGTFALEKHSSVVCYRVNNTSKNTHFPTPQSRKISQEAIDILEKFAHETYAPATEDSRLRGAG